MSSLPVTHWLLFAGVVATFLIDRLSPILGIVRGVQNRSALHAVLSFLIPLYGLSYFVVARPRSRLRLFPPEQVAL